jgi:hypothetical protein
MMLTMFMMLSKLVGPRCLPNTSRCPTVAPGVAEVTPCLANVASRVTWMSDLDGWPTAGLKVLKQQSVRPGCVTWMADLDL